MVSEMMNYLLEETCEHWRNFLLAIAAAVALVLRSEVSASQGQFCVIFSKLSRLFSGVTIPPTHPHTLVKGVGEK